MLAANHYNIRAELHALSFLGVRWLVFWSWRIAINWLINLSPDLGYKTVGLIGAIFSFWHKVTLLRLQSTKMSASRRPGFVSKLVVEGL